MFGMVLALFYAASLYVVSHATAGITYLQSTYFLYWWYLVWTIILAVVMSFVTLIVVLGGGAVGANGFRTRKYGRFNLTGMLFGVASGSSISLFLWFLFVVRRGLYVVGAYLLSTALVIHGAAGGAVYAWDTARLIIGGLLLFIALVTSAKSGSSPSSPSSD